MHKEKGVKESLTFLGGLAFFHLAISSPFVGTTPVVHYCLMYLADPSDNIASLTHERSQNALANIEGAWANG